MVEMLLLLPRGVGFEPMLGHGAAKAQPLH
jgi:hypothetical protein